MRPRYSDIQISLRPGDEEPKAVKLKKDDPFIEEAWSILLGIIAEGQEFSANTFAERLILDPNDPLTPSKKLAANGLFGRAKKLCLIEKTGRDEQSKQVAAHSRTVPIYRPIRKRRLVRIGESNGNQEGRSEERALRR